ncbi:MAG: type VI secretion system ATPase TssH [Myxococcota bacterium]
MVGVDLKSLLRKLDPLCTRALEGAAGIAVSRGHYEVTIDHLLLRLLEEPTSDLAHIFPHFDVEASRVKRAAEKAVEAQRTGNQSKPVFSPLLVSWFEDAILLGSVEYSLPRIRSGVLMLALASKPGRSGTEDYTDDLTNIRADELRREFLSIVAGSEEDETAPEAAEGVPASRPGAAEAAAAGEEALARFTYDVTAKARAGEIDPIVGRDHEIRQMVDVLSRRRKNNPIMVGEAGVGKTAVVEGFALRVAEGDVPASLKDVRVLNLDMGLLQAGAGVKGEFENRLKGVISEVKAATIPTILFVDETHTLIGAGGAQGTGDAANLLKPPLARGELRTIGATTYSEYKKYIEKDPALERRFQPIDVPEPSVDTAVEMLRAVKDKFEVHHGVRLLDEAVEAAASLGDRYISGRNLPDKAVDLIDTACARVSIGQSSKPGALDDLERRLYGLDTAIQALERDAEEALVDRDEELASLRSEREDTESRRADLHGRWSRELEEVEKLRALFDELGRARGGEAEPPEGEEAPPPPREIDAIREDIEKRTGELRSLQGGDPLVQVQADAETIAQVVSDWTGIPVARMGGDEVGKIMRFGDELRERVVGQDHAVEVIEKKIRAAKAGIQDPNQPIGVFLLVGTSGVGKTEASLAVADLLFGGERFMTTVNMSEFMESHSVSRLIGSPPGYVGYGEGGVLTEGVRHRPYSVVLLDEIEKADPEVMNLFYQVFDKGTLSDGEGRVVNFANTVIMMTSNLASDVLMEACQGDELPTPEELDALIRPALQKHLKPALLGRMTVVPFYPLSPDVLRMIAELKLGRVGKRLAESHGMEFEIDPAARNALADRCNDPESGARVIDHMIDQAILPRVSQRILEQMAEGDLPKKLTLGVDDAGEFAFSFSD